MMRLIRTLVTALLGGLKSTPKRETGAHSGLSVSPNKGMPRIATGVNVTSISIDLTRRVG